MKQFTDLVDHFRTAIPTLTLSTDVIIGFPSETEEQFNHTMQLLKKIRPDIINITRFSARPLTTAKKMNGRDTYRCSKRYDQDKLRKSVLRLSLEKNKEHLGKTYPVLVTEQGKKKTVTARTDSYKQVVLTEPVPLGSFVHVKIIDATATYLVGKLI